MEYVGRCWFNHGRSTRDEVLLDEHKKMRRIKSVESMIRTIGIYANTWEEIGGGVHNEG